MAKEGASQGQLFVVSAPSGAGKSTLIRRVLPNWPRLRFSVSCTTRAPRGEEVPGVDYHFLSKSEFVEGIDRGRFLEWAQVHGEYYGTDGERIRQWLEAGMDVLLDIDVQGARQIRCAYPHAQTIFILPPSLQALEERLRGRDTEDPDKVARRLKAAGEEIREAVWYDFIVVNDVLENAIEDFQGILRACRCHRAIQAHHVKSLVGGWTGSPALGDS